METSNTRRGDTRRLWLAGRWRWLAGVSAAALALGGLILASHTSVFHVRGIEVRGTEHRSRADVVSLSGVTLRTNAVWLDEGAVERRLEADPWIADAHVSIAFPGTLEIVVRERQPVAVERDGGVLRVVAADGTSLGTVARSGDLPLITLPTVPPTEGPAPSVGGPARALGALSAEVRSEVRRVMVSGERLSFVLRDGVWISYGAPNAFEAKAATIDEVLAWAAAEGEQLRAIDVTAPSAPAAVPAA